MTGIVKRREPRAPRSLAPAHRIILNFPPELAEQIRVLAERERRPMSKQIQVIVERALSVDESIAA